MCILCLNVDPRGTVAVGVIVTVIARFLMWVQFDFRFGCDITVVFSVLTFSWKADHLEGLKLEEIFLDIQFLFGS